MPSVFRGSLSARPGADDFYIPAEINGTNEQNTAFYVRLNFENDGERRLSGNIGLRYVELDTRVNGGITFPTLNLSPEVAATLPPEVVAFANGASSTEDARSKGIVRPGDTVQTTARVDEVLSNARWCSATVRVGGKVAVRLRFVLAVADAEAPA